MVFPLANEEESIGHKYFEALVGVMSDIGIFSGNESLKRYVLQQIEKCWRKEEQNLKFFGLQYSIDCVNYLVQNHRHAANYPELYSGLLSILEKKAIYMTAHEDISDTVISAFRVLAM